VKVTKSGMYKLKANGVLFSTPMPKIYNTLPPKVEDLDEVLAFIYIGPNKPTQKDYQRVPLLVRRNKVAAALEWLKLNHLDYEDLNISYENLATYPEDEPPVCVDYRVPVMSKDAENLAVHESAEDEEGVVDGDCPFVVHALTGAQYENKTGKQLRALAMDHLMSQGKVLGIGHSEIPESTYNNPQLYPQMFPWLFPYGLGGLCNPYGKEKVGELARKKNLLMYHDKRFQVEPLFPLVSFNHEQIKSPTTGGYLLEKKSHFPKVADRLMNLDQNTLNELISKLKNGEMVRPTTETEKECYKIINDLDLVAGHVQGSATSKKYM